MEELSGERLWSVTDAERLSVGSNRLDTLVVHAVNEC